MPRNRKSSPSLSPSRQPRPSSSVPKPACRQKSNMQQRPTTRSRTQAPRNTQSTATTDASHLSQTISRSKRTRRAEFQRDVDAESDTKLKDLMPHAEPIFVSTATDGKAGFCQSRREGLDTYLQPDKRDSGYRPTLTTLLSCVAAAIGPNPLIIVSPPPSTPLSKSRYTELHVFPLPANVTPFMRLDSFLKFFACPPRPRRGSTSASARMSNRVAMLVGEMGKRELGRRIWERAEESKFGSRGLVGAPEPMQEEQGTSDDNVDTDLDVEMRIETEEEAETQDEATIMEEISADKEGEACETSAEDQWDLHNFVFDFRKPSPPSWRHERWTCKEPSRLRMSIIPRNRSSMGPPSSSGTMKLCEKVKGGHEVLGFPSPSTPASNSTAAPQSHSLPLCDLSPPPSSPLHASSSLELQEAQQQQQQQNQRMTEPPLWKCASLSRVEQSCAIWGVERVRSWIERDRIRWGYGSGEGDGEVGNESPATMSECQSEQEAQTGFEHDCDSGQHDSEESLGHSNTDDVRVVDVDFEGSDADGEYELDDESYESLGPTTPPTTPSHSPLSPSFSFPPPSSSNMNLESSLTSLSPQASFLPASTSSLCPPAACVGAVGLSRTSSNSSTNSAGSVSGIEDEEWDDIDVPGIEVEGFVDAEDDMDTNSEAQLHTEATEEEDFESEDDGSAGSMEGDVAFRLESPQDVETEVGGVEIAFRLEAPPSDAPSPSSALISGSHEVTSAYASPTTAFEAHPTSSASLNSQVEDESTHENEGSIDLDLDSPPSLLRLPALSLREPIQTVMGFGTPAEAPQGAIGVLGMNGVPSVSASASVCGESRGDGESGRKAWMEVARRIGERGCSQVTTPTPAIDIPVPMSLDPQIDANDGARQLQLPTQLQMVFPDSQLDLHPAPASASSIVCITTDPECTQVVPGSVEHIDDTAVNARNEDDVNNGGLWTDCAAMGLGLGMGALGFGMGFHAGFGVGVHVGFGLAQVQTQATAPGWQCQSQAQQTQSAYSYQTPSQVQVQEYHQQVPSGTEMEGAYDAVSVGTPSSGACLQAETYPNLDSFTVGVGVTSPAACPTPSVYEGGW